jgi:hypothetical protein
MGSLSLSLQPPSWGVTPTTLKVLQKDERRWWTQNASAERRAMARRGTGALHHLLGEVIKNLVTKR